MGARPQGRLVPISTPPWPPHGPGRGPRKQSGNRSPKKSVKERCCGPPESKTEVLGGHFDAFFASGGKVRTELSPARELRSASLARSPARPFSCVCSSKVKNGIPVWLFDNFIDFGAPVGIPKQGQNPFPPLPHPCLVGLGWVLMAQLEPLGRFWHHFMTLLGAIL